MGLTDLVVSGVRAAFLATEDLAQEMTLQGPSTFDDVTEAETPGATTTSTCLVTQYKVSDVDGVDVQMGDVKCLIEAAAISIAPDIGQVLTVGGSRYQVVNVNNIAGLGALFVCQLRRAA